jgi:6-pyruvoyltetrahydropterin/6-carboxytetrahydropterin synthase
MEFSASHRFWCEDWDAVRNRAVFGAGASRFSHGHNYALEVTLRGSIDAETGMVMDLKQLKDVMQVEVAARFDHRNLNEDCEYFVDRPASAENLALVIFDLLDAALPAGALHAVRLAPLQDLAVEVTR